MLISIVDHHPDFLIKLTKMSFFWELFYSSFERQDLKFHLSYVKGEGFQLRGTLELLPSETIHDMWDACCQKKRRMMMTLLIIMVMSMMMIIMGLSMRMR